LDWYGIRPTAFAQGGEGGEGGAVRRISRTSALVFVFFANSIVCIFSNHTHLLILGHEQDSGEHNR
jgi:hypothetical protein